MGALPQTHIKVPVHGVRKPPTVETNPKLDKYGRNPNSAGERLRAQTDFDADTGYSPLYHATIPDMTRLVSGVVCYSMILVINMLSLGREHGRKEPRHKWTLPVSVAYLAEVCGCNVRDVQRQLAELQSRGMVAVKQSRAGGTVKYEISLLYSKWQGIEDYAVWKRRQTVVMIDEAAAELAEDEAVPEISKDAVRLCKKPQRIAPGRASRSVRVDVGVKSFQVVNGADVELIYDPVISSGCLTFSVASVETKSEGFVKPATPMSRTSPQVHESKESIPSNGGSPKQAGQTKVNPLVVTHPRAGELSAIFDPLLAASGARLLSGDPQSLKAACEAVQDCGHDFLVKFVLQRAERPVKSPLHIATICAEALASWRVSNDGAGLGVSMTDIKAMAAKERAARLGKKR